MKWSPFVPFDDDRNVRGVDIRDIYWSYNSSIHWPVIVVGIDRRRRGGDRCVVWRIRTGNVFLSEGSGRGLGEVFN